MIDYCLKFSTKEQAHEILYAGTTEFPEPLYLAIDEIGLIYKPSGTMLQGEFGEFPEMEPTPGYHVNVRHSVEAPELEVYQVFPVTPIRVWA
jgi:hypothetical protein